ncbi:hypothetical protein DFH94DRAFT_727266 [Russula ochroleuca]|uniref:Uncharacterized protein n=1 Tax=Russula ochroleuca TaxID=152965 RepID=A0A9P5TAJ8_9AGAM|nr:hypothetical protein DFH94DRAFT_727266 [Russula ochroleuca]
MRCQWAADASPVSVALSVALGLCCYVHLTISRKDLLYESDEDMFPISVYLSNPSPFSNRKPIINDTYVYLSRRTALRASSACASTAQAKTSPKNGTPY